MDNKLATSYECDICLSINHVKRVHCQNCGTIPPSYSILRTNSRVIETDDFARYIPVVKAYGYDRVEFHHTSRSYLRTVPMDYYADSAA